MEKAVKAVEKNYPSLIEDLKGLLKIPTVSFDGFPREEMVRGANAVADLLKKAGLQNVELLDVPGAFPYVYGERLKAPGMPTVLLYAHYDVQPPGREPLWESPPFAPTLRNSPQGERLFARGSADDKAGILMHTAAISAWLEAHGELPINVKVVIEGEEEVGSAHLDEFLKIYRKKLDADVLVITDTGNFDVGMPAITVGLRGLVAMQVEVRALTKTVHSGMFGGPIPDPVIGLSRMLAGLVDDNGRIAVPGVMEQVAPIDAKELAELNRIPFNDKEFRAQAGMVPSLQYWKADIAPSSQVWRLPSVTVTAIQASSRKMAANIINDTAWAKVTIRLVKGMDPEKTTQALEKYFKAKVPWGLELELTGKDGGAAWSTETDGPAFEALNVALTKGYGKEPFKIGCGGSIGFVGPFVEALGGAPALLMGVEDPFTNAHGENESVLLADLKKGFISETIFFGELAKRWKK